MKKQFFILFSMLFFLISCRKESLLPVGDFTRVPLLKGYLKDSMTINDFGRLNFNGVTITNYNNGLKIILVPFVDSVQIQKFVAIKITGLEEIDEAKIIEMTMDTLTDESRGKKAWDYSGQLTITSLAGNNIFSSPIENGYIKRSYSGQTANNHRAPMNLPTIDLPEVIVMSHIPTSGGQTYSTWVNMSSMFSNFGGGGNYYQNTYQSTGGGGGGGAVPPKAAVQIDFETGNLDPAVDLAKFLKCFTGIIDAGSTCTIKILTDIPMDGDPFAFFDYKTGSPGHTFLQFNKTNGSQSVQQNIGFYPVLDWKSIFATTPQTGKFVDNQGHEFNASLSMNLSPDKFKEVLMHMQYLSQFVKYDLDEYNCTDFALDIFNYRRDGSPLTIQKFDISAGLAPDGSNTPQGLYQKLESMGKNTSDPESKNITIPGVKGFAGNSNGACN
ncbi:MAG: hypothetical protein ABIU77_17235 [Ferruginibacter sp.]